MFIWGKMISNNLWCYKHWVSGSKIGLRGTVILVLSEKLKGNKPNQLGCMRADEVYGIAVACNAVFDIQKFLGRSVNIKEH